MNTDEFWKIIDRVHAASPRDMDAKHEALRSELKKLSDFDLLLFQEHFNVADERAYNWKLWGAAYLIGGGCSDDSFWDFRSTLISMGRQFYEKTLVNPDSLANEDYDDDFATNGGFDYQYVMHREEEERFGERLERSIRYRDKPSGTAWDDEDLPTMLPMLCKKYPWIIDMINSKKDK